MQHRPLLTAVQTELIERLRGEPDLAGIPIAAIRGGRLPQKLNEALLSASGLSVLVFPPLPTIAQIDVPGPALDEIAVRVRLLDHAIAQAPDTPALWDVAEVVMRRLHLWQPTDARVQRALSLNPINGWTVTTPVASPIRETGGHHPERTRLDLSFTFGAVW